MIQTKHWRDAAESFNFPETITSVSFSLRKAYITFLWDYEQVRTQMAVCTHTYIYVDMHVCMSICNFHVYMSVCMSMCLYASIYALSTTCNDMDRSFDHADLSVVMCINRSSHPVICY